MGETNDDADHDYVMAEYEDRFQEIDSKLDAMRASFIDMDTATSTSSPNHVGATIIVEDDEDDDNITLDESLSMHVGKLQATLAETSATEMERIVHTLQRQQKDDGTHDNQALEKEKAASQAAAKTISSLSSSGSTTPRWMFLLVLVPTLLSAILAYQLWFSSPDSSLIPVVVQEPQEPFMRLQQAYTRQVCRMVNGHRYCETAQESQSTSSRGEHHQEMTYERQQCRYINGQEYCESDQESQSTSIGSGHQGGQEQQRQQVYYQRQQCRYVNGESYCESYEGSQTAS